MSDFVREEAAAIRGKMANATIFGQPLDWDSPDAVLVAAYYLGKQEANRQALHDLDTLHELDRLAGEGRLGNP